MVNTVFNSVIKRTNQTGTTMNPTFSPFSLNYRRAVLTCTIGSIDSASTSYSYPLLALSFINRVRQSK